MAGISGGTLLLAICLLHLHFHVESRLVNPQKPTKHDYTIEFEKVETVSPGRLFVDPKTDFSSVMYNDTARVLQADMYTATDVPEDAMMAIVVHKFEPKTNKWLPFVKRSDPLCNYLGESSTLIKDAFIFGNMTRGCPLLKGYYYLRNYMQVADEFPFHLDEGQWLVKILFVEKATGETAYGFAVTASIVPIDDED